MVGLTDACIGPEWKKNEQKEIKVYEVGEFVNESIQNAQIKV